MEREIRVVRLDDASREQSPSRIHEADTVAHARARLIERVARGECSVPEACREAGISRARFYQLRDAYLRHGLDGLRPKPRPKRRPARLDRRVPLATEEAIVAYALLHPTHGERSIAEALSRSELGGLRVSPHGVGGVLRRAGLSRAERRRSVASSRRVDRSIRIERIPDDDEMFSRLYERYRRYVYSVCLRRLGDPAKAEDAMQETFARVYANLSRFDARQKVRPWVRTIAVNVCTTIYHRSARVEVQDLTDEAWFERRGGEEPLETMMEKERRERLERALAALPARQRRALLLHALEGWDYGDIASAEGTSVQAVKSLLFRARESLRHAREVGVLGLVVPPWRRIREQFLGRYVRTRAAVSRALGSEMVAPSAQMIAAFVTAIMVLISAGVFSQQQAAGLGQRTSYALAGSPDTPGRRIETARARGTVRPSGARGVRTQSSTSIPWDEYAEGMSEALGKAILDPMGNAMPETTTFTAIRPSPSFDRDRTVFAIGVHPCFQQGGNCPALFVTHDGGAHWERRAADGLVSWVMDLVLPPAYPSDPRIFALDYVGLKESTDGGASFHLVSPLSVSTAGGLAMSPQFNDGDPRILMVPMGLPSLMEYRADDKLTKPVPLPLVEPTARLRPVFSPDYAADGLVFVGEARRAPKPTESGNPDEFIYGWENGVRRCDRLRCDAVTLGGGNAVPLVRLSPAFHDDQLGFALQSRKIFRSQDGLRTFAELDFPPDETNIGDIALQGPSENRGPLIAAAFVGYRTKSLYKSLDQGSTWIPIPVNLPDFEMGFKIVRFAGTHRTIFAAGWEDGIVCSTNDGETWATRC